MKERKGNLLEYLEVVVRWRRVIVRNVFIVVLVSVIISLLLVQQFTATATILPPSSEQIAFMGLIVGGQPGGVAGIPGLRSVLPGLSTPSDLYAAIMRSGSIKGRIIKRFNLKQKFRAKTMYDTYKMLENITQIKVSPEGIVSVSVTYRDKYLATDIANAYVEELEKFNRETAMTSGKRYRLFIEKRLRETEDSLAKAEEILRNFQEKYRTIALDTEIEKVIETIASLKSQIILKEVLKGAAGVVNNPYTRSIDQELRALRKQLAKIEFADKTERKNEFGAGFSVPLSKIPEVSLEYARLLRDVKTQEAVYELLTQQYEQAKIMEAKDTPTVQILDEAKVPEKKSSPNRRLITLLAFYCAVIFSILYVILFHYYSKYINKAVIKDLIDAIRKDLRYTRTIIYSFIKKPI